MKTLEELKKENCDIDVEIKLKIRDINDIKITCAVLEKYNFIVARERFIKEIIKIEKEVEELESQKHNIENEIKDLMKNCSHNFIYIGHDSHHDYYKCNKCGIEEKY